MTKATDTATPEAAAGSAARTQDKGQLPSGGLLGRLASRMRGALFASIDERHGELSARLARIASQVAELESREISTASRVAELVARSAELVAFRDTQTSRLQAIEDARALLEDGVEALRRDADSIRSHLASLQDDHTALKATAASLEDLDRKQLEAMARFELLWKDVQSDLEGFAKVLSQLGKDTSSR